METLPLLEQCLARWLQRHSIAKVFVCGRQLHPPIYSHVVGFPRLEIPIKGCYENTIEQNGQRVKIDLRPGAILFVAPNCWNLPTWRLNVELISILFGKKHLGVTVVSGRGPEDPKLAVQKYSTRFPPTGPISHILNALIEVQAANASHAAFPELSIALVRCVHELLQNPTERGGHRAQSLLESVCVYLQNHYQYNITRESVAQEFKISPNHLSRLFQTQGHMTFNNYLTHVRIDRGKHLLCSYDLKLNDVASRCGYHDTPYFCRVFKRIAKATPAEYRAIYRSRNVARDVST
jgi:AraC-like DNA-binding protein